MRVLSPAACSRVAMPRAVATRRASAPSAPIRARGGREGSLGAGPTTVRCVGTIARVVRAPSTSAFDDAARAQTDDVAFPRVAAAVRLAAAVAPAVVLAGNRAREPAARVARAAAGGGGSSRATLGDEDSEFPATGGVPGIGRKAWWGEGTYTQSLRRGGTLGPRAIGGAAGGAKGDDDASSDPSKKKLSDLSKFTSGPQAASASAAASDAPTDADADDADTMDGSDQDESSSGSRTPRANPFELLYVALVKPLRDFGFGRTSVWEGGVGLFILGGMALTALVVNWVLGVNFNKMRSYQAFVEFPFACGIQVGTQVRVRGVKVGNVLSVRPNLERVEVLVEMDDDGIVIPRNSLVEANQSGLIAETIIDITPEIPIPKAQWGPLDSGCEGEGLVVCDRGKIQGTPGVSMDELVGICTKLAREMDSNDGIAKMFATAETAQDLMKNLEPLLLEAAEIAKELRPMLQNVQEQGTLDTIELLAGHATKAVTDIRELKRTILTDDNQEMLRQSITIMTKTLQHMEKVSGDISSVSGDPATRQNLRHLIQCLSRLVDK